MSKPKGIYLVNEVGCLNPNTGAYRHISVGFEQLNKNYAVILVTPDGTFGSIPHTNDEIAPPNKIFKKDVNKLRGFFRDLAICIKNFSKLYRHYKRLKSLKSDFIYERASYLNYNGLIVSKLLRVPHFYEVNGIQFLAVQNYYLSYFRPIAETLERCAYRNSSYNFFVGSYGHSFKIKKKNWINIENGVEEELINFAIKKKDIKNNINLCFIAKLMPHQKVNVLIDGMKALNNKTNITLYLIGSGLGEIEEQLKEIIHVVNLGFLNRHEMFETVAEMHIGIVAGSPEFQSAMKAYDYALGKCAVVVPNVFNFRYWFDKDEIFFFENNNPDSLAFCLDTLIENPVLISTYGDKLYNKVKTNFTWNKIYGNVTNIISGVVNENTSYTRKLRH